MSDATDTQDTADTAQPARPRKLRVPGQPADTAQPAAAEAAPALDGLPNAIDVDARAIPGPVMTRQGWVVNDEVWQKANPAEYAKLRVR